MKRYLPLVLSIAGGLALLLGLAGCSSGNATGSSQVPIGHQFRADEQGNVTIDATWDLTDNGTIVFDIAMSTHSVPLDGYDLAELALLRDSTGAEYRPTSWESEPGGHHRRGRLTFPAAAALTAGTDGGFIELIIRNVADIPERTVRWDL